MVSFYDYVTRATCTSISDDIAVDYYGNRLKRVSRNMAMDIETGELHAITPWDSDDD